MAGPTDWSFQTSHVGSEDIYNGKDFISSESIVICSIPANKRDSATEWKPIGLLENATLQQNKQINQLFEIGSKKSYIVPGRTYKRLSLSRVLFNGDSLLKVITSSTPYPTDDSIATNDAPAGGDDARLYIDIASAYFNVPVDLGFVIHDQEDDAFGAFALTGCYVQSHQMSLSGQQTVVMENVTITVDDIIPAEYAPENNS
jgi:hypothetical protein